MQVRSRAPLRLGLAGGGTDVSPYSDQYGGAVLNATIDMHAHCSLTDETSQVVFEALDLNMRHISEPGKQSLDGDLLLHKATYNRIMKDFNQSVFLPLKVTTYSDAPIGSGLGSSSTLVVAILKAFQELLGLPLGEYDLARLAYEIEREDCNLSGGKQDQYAAAFGGFNYMEFFNDDRVIVNPLRIKHQVLTELEANTNLFFTGVSRHSSEIINDQILAVHDKGKLEALHQVKHSAILMKEAILKANMQEYFNLQKQAWKVKKRTSSLISNNLIDNISREAFDAGAIGLKVSGAGGGGFMLIFSEPEKKFYIKNKLKKFDGIFYNFHFSDKGAESWVVKR